MQFNNIDEYIKHTDGKLAIKRILIANNGIGAVKFIRSVRRWSYVTFGNEKEVKFVSMASAEDLQANAEYIRMSDQVVEVSGGSNVNNYANVTLIVELAIQYEVNAVWAGWGHASENPNLPNSLDKINIKFIGPPGGPMHALGDKIGSTIIAQSAEVPTIAWNAGELKLDYKTEKSIPADLYDKASIKSVEQCKEAIKKIGLPVMIKASEGGGGKGIRKVTEESNIESAFRQVQSELPGSPIFVMALASKARHLEVQLLADDYGQAIALSGRDCSVQRRHQKILEEGPPTAATGSVWKDMERAAVRLAKEVGYINAGTVEYLFTEEDKKFYFLELNPRLQVEHPVTEMITSVNLPAAQLQVAMGIPLHRIPDIRRWYGHVDKDIYGNSKIDFDNQDPIGPQGHTIAARITAENPNKGFQPTSGKIQELNFRSSRNVWGYFSVDSSGNVHEFADSQIGHIFSFGEDRESARRNLVLALNDMSIRGDIRTTIEYLKDLIEADDYKNNKFDTAWLDERIKNYKQPILIDPVDVVLIGAGIEAITNITNREQDYISSLERGQLPSVELLNQEYNSELIYDNIKYILKSKRTGPSTYLICLNDSYVEQEIKLLSDGGFLILMGGKSHVAYTKQEVGATRLVMDGNTCLFVDEYDPTQIRANMGGKLLRYLVEDQSEVKKDQPFAEIEVMKMNMQLTAAEDGIITLEKPAGSVMEPGDVISTLELKDPSKVHKAELYLGKLPNHGDPWPEAKADMPHHRLNNAIKLILNAMSGYQVQDTKKIASLNNIKLALKTPLLPYLEVNDLFARIKHTLPFDLQDLIKNLGNEFKKNVVNVLNLNDDDVPERAKTPFTVPSSHENKEELSKAIALASNYANDLIDLINKYYNDLKSNETKKDIEASCEQIKTTASSYINGMHSYTLNIVSNLLERYLESESKFAELESSNRADKDDVLQELRREYTGELNKVYELSLSHSQVKEKNSTALTLLEIIELCVRKEEQLIASGLVKKQTYIRDMAVKLLLDIAALNLEETNEVALEARQMLIELQQPSYQQSLAKIKEDLVKVSQGDKKVVQDLIDSTEAILHMLMEIISSSNDKVLRSTALEMYVRRVYHTYKLVDLKIEDLEGLGLVASWHFYSESNEIMGGLSSVGPDGKPTGSMISSAESFDNLQALLSGGVSTSMGSGNDSITDGGDSRTGGLARQQSHRPRAGSGWDDIDDSVSNNSFDNEYYESNEQIGHRKNNSFDNSVNKTIDNTLAKTGKYSGGEGVPANVMRHGLLAYFNNFDNLKTNFDKLLNSVDTNNNNNKNDDIKYEKPVNALHVIINQQEELLYKNDNNDNNVDENNEISKILYKFLENHHNQLNDSGIRRITFAIPPPLKSDLGFNNKQIVAGHGSGFFTYRNRSKYQEDRLVRHIETPLAFQLDLKRLSNFNISLVPLGKNLSMSHIVHVYQGVPKIAKQTQLNNKDDKKLAKPKKLKKRYFVRALVRSTTKMNPNDNKEDRIDSYPGPERVLVQALAALEAIQGTSQVVGARRGSDNSGQNHIFLNILGDAEVDASYLERVCRFLTRRYAKRLLTCRVAEVELKVNIRLDDSSPVIPIRIISSNPTGFALRVDSYIEAADVNSPSRTLFYSVSANDGTSLAAMMGVDGLDNNNNNDDINNNMNINNNDDDDEDNDILKQAAAIGNNTHSSVNTSATLHAPTSENQASGLGELHGKETSIPYPISTPYDDRRSRALAAGTCFVYDLPALFQRACEIEWRKFATKHDNITPPPSTQLVKVEELILDDEMDTHAPFENGEFGLSTTLRPAGTNKIAMVVFRMFLLTPQYSELPGREVVVIANDITFKAGSFGTREDEIFLRASKYSRARGIPKVYIAANSGARIGMAEEVKQSYKVKFIDENDKAKGFEYIYLDNSDYKLLGPNGRKSVLCEPVKDNGKIIHHKITAIVGEGRDLGVENLRGSGEIGGETSRAYDETFTVSYVAGRSVGIGAYLIRLGQRVIQKGTMAPILLTGYSALNSLMGKQVYTSNQQLGGPSIMYNNGVSHLCVRDDLEGISAIVDWLSYIPERKGEPLPLTQLQIGDILERDIEYIPSKEMNFDPRLLLTGEVDPITNKWKGGLLDKGSFVELLGGWGKSVITGRGRLGRIPVGIILPEQRTSTKTIPADPSTVDSKEQVISQPGNVFFPDSSYKTATAIKDINREGLPLILMANFRGFSGGQRDMYDEVLKFGSMIVDALVEFKQPVIVYLPPYSELRGGAWVVVDPTINLDQMEIYADKDARGGVLEPSGSVSIKYRTKDQIATMHRVDNVLIDLDNNLNKLKDNNGDINKIKSIKQQIFERERKLLPVFHQIALHFADNHDKPGRMLAKEVISGVIEWKQARKMLFWRLKRRLQENMICDQLIKESSSQMKLKTAKKALKNLCGHIKDFDTNNREVLAWMNSKQGMASINSLKQVIKKDAITKKVTELGLQDSNGVLKGIVGIINALNNQGRTHEREQFISNLRRGIFVLSSNNNTGASLNASTQKE